MRIAHVTDGYLPRLGGIEIQVDDLARAQLTAGHDVEIITATPADGTRDTMAVHRPDRGHDRATAGASIALATSRALNGHFDVLHVHLSIASPLALSVLWRAAAAGLPTVATMHSLWGPAEPALGAARRVLGERAVSVAWTAVSTAAAEPLRRRLDVPVSVVPNGVDLAWWARAPRSTPHDHVRLLSVLRLTRRKRPLPLLRMVQAAHRLTCASTARPLSLTVVGEGSLRRRLRRQVERSDVDVTLTGRLDRSEIRDRAGAHDLYVAPAPLESFGLAALEARSAGLPVIAYRHSGVADFVEDGWDGLLVDDDTMLTAAVAELVGSPELLSTLQANARRTVPDLGWSHTLLGYDDAYRAARARTGRVRPLPPTRIVAATA